MRFSTRHRARKGIKSAILNREGYITTANTAQTLPPPINHPEFYYGFASTVLAWQVAFIVMSCDPLKHRPLMIPAIMEKMVYVVSIIFLAFQRRVGRMMIGFAAMDFILGNLFIISYILTGKVRPGAERQG